VDVLWIHRLGGSGMVDFAKGSVKERGRAARGLVGLTATAVETVGSADVGGCVSKRIFTGLRGAMGGLFERDRRWCVAEGLRCSLGKNHWTCAGRTLRRLGWGEVAWRCKVC
jgi:hypothetical protein